MNYIVVWQATYSDGSQSEQSFFGPYETEAEAQESIKAYLPTDPLVQATDFSVQPLGSRL